MKKRFFNLSLSKIVGAVVRPHLRFTQYLSVFWISFLVLLLASCTGQPTRQFASASVVDAIGGGKDASQDQAFAHATAPRPFTFPRDHGPHPEYRTEWWYYTGNLQDNQGNQYGYQLTFFRSALTAQMPARQSDLATNQFYMAHFAVTSQPANEHLSFERYSRGAAGLAGATGDPRYQVWLEDWAVKQTGDGVYQLQAATQDKSGPVAITFTLHETRPPVLHGNAGLSQKGPEPGNANYYYSLVNLATTGQITFAGKTVSIKGLSWMDHEFGTSSLGGDITGWDWFSAQLDNGAVLMFGTFHDAKGESRYVYEGSLVFPDNHKVRLTKDDFVVKALAQWKSPTTGITYPSGWQVNFPKYNLTLAIQPLIPDQEMEVRFIYYEGATTIKATMNGAAVNGRGYVELTGYGEQLKEYQR